MLEDTALGWRVADDIAATAALQHDRRYAVALVPLHVARAAARAAPLRPVTVIDSGVRAVSRSCWRAWRRASARCRRTGSPPTPHIMRDGGSATCGDVSTR